jgi:hypothetical protein
LTPVFLATPPFTQLNTPYPGTAYLKGFLNTKSISSVQADLGIEVILALFSTAGLTKLFEQTTPQPHWSSNSLRIYYLQHSYILVIDAVILFLQGKNASLADRIVKRTFLPEASRFKQLSDLQWAFGSMGIQDKAKHLATLFLEDLSDFIQECVDEHFGFSRYAERLGRSANQFDELYQTLQQPLSYIDKIHIEILAEHLRIHQPKLVAFSVPFPGNLLSAFRAAQWIKQNHPKTAVAMGGGFPNTELRSLSDKRVFEFFDFISLDDGEAPLESILDFIENKRSKSELKRTFCLDHNDVLFSNHSACRDYKQHEVGTPDYSGLPLDRYISVIEIANPMHRLWSDGVWNKLTMAHGCYWGKCTFCDISLPYISDYEPLTASLLCDRIEQLIKETHNRSFHFVDEAAPPALMRALALEILHRKLNITWWTNIRFEKSFTRDLCLLLRESGCIAVSGGLEVASDRLLQLIQKGVTVEQVTRVAQHFTQAGIMVHAYLMYGYPTQTIQETIDSLDMVRQMFKAGILQSGFWHQFALTTHSPIGHNPTAFKIRITQNDLGTFANNDLQYADSTGIDHNQFSFGLKKSLYNFMHQECLDHPLQEWFDMKIPKPNVKPDFIEQVLTHNQILSHKPTSKVIYLGSKPLTETILQTKKGRQRELLKLSVETKSKTCSLQVEKSQGEWLVSLLDRIKLSNTSPITFAEVQQSYEAAGLEDFDLFWFNKPMNTIHEMGLLVL